MAYIGQREDEWEAEQRKKARAERRKNTEACELCGKRVSKQGLTAHLRDVHQLKRESIPRPKYKYTAI